MEKSSRRTVSRVGSSADRCSLRESTDHHSCCAPANHRFDLMRLQDTSPFLRQFRSEWTESYGIIFSSSHQRSQMDWISFGVMIKLARYPSFGLFLSVSPCLSMRIKHGKVGNNHRNRQCNCEHAHESTNGADEPAEWGLGDLKIRMKDIRESDFKPSLRSQLYRWW